MLLFETNKVFLRLQRANIDMEDERNIINSVKMKLQNLTKNNEIKKIQQNVMNIITSCDVKVEKDEKKTEEEITCSVAEFVNIILLNIGKRFQNHNIIDGILELLDPSLLKGKEINENLKKKKKI
jgi:hypothetical protein